jgi:hypothetical protein
MDQFVLDEATAAQLTQVNGEVDLVDPSGRKIGVFLTPEAYLQLCYDIALSIPSDKELEEARQDYKKNGGVTTAQILAQLISLEEEGDKPS